MTKVSETTTFFKQPNSGYTLRYRDSGGMFGVDIYGMAGSSEEKLMQTLLDHGLGKVLENEIFVLESYSHNRAPEGSGMILLYSDDLKMIAVLTHGEWDVVPKDQWDKWEDWDE